MKIVGDIRLAKKYVHLTLIVGDSVWRLKRVFSKSKNMRNNISKFLVTVIVEQRDSNERTDSYGE